MVKFTLFQVFLIWVIGFGTISLMVRKKFAILVDRFRFPRVVKYYLVAIPIILMEESLTIKVPFFWGILPMLLIFCVHLLPLYLIQRYTRCSFLLSSALFGAWGCFNEFILVGRIHRISGLTLVIMCVLCFLIYAVMAILPAYWLQTSTNTTP